MPDESLCSNFSFDLLAEKKSVREGTASYSLMAKAAESEIVNLFFRPSVLLKSSRCSTSCPAQLLKSALQDRRVLVLVEHVSGEVVV